MAGLRRALGLGAVLVYCFGDILGAGIYALVGEVAGEAGRAAPWSFLLALAVASLTALTYAELGGRYSRSGIEVRVVLDSWGREWAGLLVGWMVLCSAVISAAAVSHAFAGYLATIVPATPRPLSVAVFLLAVAAINFWGIETSSRTNIAFTVVEASGLVFVVVAGAWFLWGGDSSAVAATAASGSPVSPQPGSQLASIARGAALAFFAFVGFEDAVNVVEEVRRPGWVFPRALLGAIGLAGVLYFAVAWVAIRVVTPAELAAAEGPLVAVVRRSVPGSPEWLFAAVAMFAVANTGLLNSITASRLLYGVSRQGLLPRWLGAIHEGRRTPHWAVVAVLVASGVLALAVGGLGRLAGATSALLLAIFATVAAALVTLKLRERRRDGSGEDAEERQERLSNPLPVPLAAAASAVALAFFLPPDSLLVGLAMVVIGGAAIALRRFRGTAGDDAGPPTSPGDQSE